MDNVRFGTGIFVKDMVNGEKKSPRRIIRVHLPR